MARTVTGSVADKVAPTDMASMKERLMPSRGIRAHRKRMTPSMTAEIKVPAKANVRMVPMLRKKLPYMTCSQHCSVAEVRNRDILYLVQLIARSQDDGRKE